MPLNITDEALDMLDKTPDGERIKFFDGLNDEERGQLAIAIPAWKAKRSAAAAQPSVPVTAPPIAPIAAPEQPIVTSVPGPQAPTDYATEVQNFRGNMRLGANEMAPNPTDFHPVDGANWVKDQLLKPTVQPLRRAGSAFVEAITGIAGLNSDAPLPGGTSLAALPEATLARQAGKFWTMDDKAQPGRINASSWNDRDAAESERALKQMFGDSGGEAAKVVADMAGQAPLLLLGGGHKAASATEAAANAARPLLSRLGSFITQHAATGAKWGAGSAVVTPGSKIEEGAAFGAVAGPVLAGAARGVTKGIPALGRAATTGLARGMEKVGLLPEHIALLPPSTVETLVREIALLDPSYNPPLVPNLGEPGVTAVSKLSDITPSIATIVVEDGKVIGRFVEIGPNGQRVFDMPIESMTDAIKFRNARTGQPFSCPVTGDTVRELEAMGNGRLWTSALLGDVPAGTGRPAGMLTGPGTNVGMKTVRAAERAAERAKRLQITPVGQPGVPTGGGPVVEPLDSPPVGPNITPLTVMKDADGRIAVQQIPGAEPKTGNMRAPLPPSGPPEQKMGVGPPSAPEPAEPAGPHEKGAQVYVRLPNGQHRTATYLGADGQGNLLVSKDTGRNTVDQGTLQQKGPQEAVPSSEVFPANFGVADPATLSIPAPPQAPPAQVGQLPPHQVEAHNLITGLVRRFGKQPSVLSKVVDSLIGKGYRGPQELRLKVQAALSAQALEATNQDSMRAMRNAMRGDFKQNGLLSEFDRDLNEVASGRKHPDEMQKYGRPWERVKQLINDQLAERDLLDQKLADLGMVPDQLIADRDTGKIDAYLTRQYLSRVMAPGEWAKRAEKMDVIDPAISAVMEQADKAGKQRSYHEAAVIVHDMIRAPNPMETYMGYAQSEGVSGKLKRLQDIDPRIRAAMGEVNSGMYRIASSLGIQRGLAAQGQLMAEVASNPRYYSPGPRADLHSVALPNNPRAFGKAAGGYVTPEMYDALVNLPKAIDQAPVIARTLYSFMKGNQIGWNPSVLLKNTVEDIWHSVLAGGLDPMRPSQSGKAAGTALQALRAYAANPSATEGPGALIAEAKKFGSIKPGYGQVEVAGVQRQFADALDKAIQKNGGVTDVWSLRKLAGEVMQKHRQFMAKGADIQDFMTHWFRAANHIALAEKFTAQGMTRQDAAALAAMRVNSSFQDPTNLGPAIAKMRGQPFGFAAPYLAPLAEEARVWGLVPKRLAEEPDLKWRLGATGVLMGTIFGVGGVARRMNGISDEEVDATTAELTKRQRAFKPALVAAPWRDGKGRPQLYDMTGFSYLAGLLQGHPDDAMWRRVLANTLTLPTQGSNQEAALQGILSKAGLTRQMEQMTPMEGENDFVKFLNTAQDAGFGAPSEVSRVHRALVRAGALGTQGRNAEQWTGSQAAQFAAGIPVAPQASLPEPGVGSPALRASTMENVGDINEMKKQMSRAARSPLPSEERNRLIEAMKARIELNASQLKDRSAKVQAAQSRKGQ